MQEITLEAIMRVVFGPLRTGSLLRLRGLLRELTERMNMPRRLALLAVLGPRSMVGDPRFRRTLQRVEAAVLEEIRKRRAQAASGAGSDIASLLAGARYEDGAPMTARDLRDELVTLLLDGPTSTSLAWVFERLLRHPDKLARLREEVERGETDAYLDAVVRETLRLCPPVPIVVRKLLAPVQLGGYTVPAGTMVAPCIHLVHRREDVYPQPRSFMPERFLQRPAGTYTWIPFGGGARRCLAASFALLEMKRVTTAVLEEVQLRPAQSPSEQVKKSAISYSPGRRGLVIVTGPGAGRRARTPVFVAAPARGGRGVSDTPNTPAPEADLIVVGAGAKAAAIAAKVHVLNSLGLGPIALTIVEATEPAASWSGRNGMTSGEEPLAIPPIKDVGFPYQSHQSFGETHGDEIDRAMLPFTWQRHMIEQRRYVRWVNAGSPPIQHRTYGRYLAWVLERATEGVALVRGRVTGVSLDSERRWRIDVAESGGAPRYVARALALTGPGVHRPFSPRSRGRGPHLSLRLQARRARAHPARSQRRDSDRRRRRERAQLRGVPARLPAQRTADDLHADACRSAAARAFWRTASSPTPTRLPGSPWTSERAGTSSSTATAASSTRRRSR